MPITPLPLVLLHGWGFGPAIWHPLRAALAQADGQRPLWAEAVPFCSVLADTLNALQKALPERAHLVGWSLGGEIALAYSHLYPERVQSLTLISSTPCFVQQPEWIHGQPATLLEDFEQRLNHDPAGLLKRFATLIRHGDTAALKNKMLSEGLMQAAETNAAQRHAGLSLLRHIDLRHEAPTLTIPLQLIHGSADAVVPLTAAQWLKNQRQCLLHTLEQGSHALPITHSLEIARYLADHLRLHDATR